MATMRRQRQHSMTDDTWRIFRIMAEFVDGFETLSRVGPCITLFGSARTEEDHDFFRLAYDTARCAVENGYGVITGGGPGIMEAANRGANEAGGHSIGLNIELPYEQLPNASIKTLINFRHFFIRKVMFLKYTSAVIVLPGGFGTMDEVFETLTLIQTQKASHLPLVLMGLEYWKGLLDWLKDTMLSYKYIDPEDMKLIQLTDDPHESIEIINAFYKKRESDVNFV
jgi:uncharacterized protein (TIGR00730 family)